MATIEVPPLIEILAEIPDPRQSQGRRHSLASMLALACVATLCGYQRLMAIAEWGQNYGEEYKEVLGFEKHGYPGQATWYRVFSKVDVEQVEEKLMAWCEKILQALQKKKPDQMMGISIDGKTLRGSQRQGAENSHLLSAYVQQIGLVLGQVAVEDKTNEIGAIESFLLQLALNGRVITTDALLTQQNVAETIIENGGDYVLPVKRNQELTYAAIERWFAEPAPYELPNNSVEYTEKSNGRLTRWHLEASTALNDYLDWRGLQQVFKITRTVIYTKTGEKKTDIHYGISSLTPQQADDFTLLTFKRGYWGIENSLHWVRDVTFDEDRSVIRVGQTHHLMAILRNIAISLLRLSGHTQIATTLRYFAAQPQHAMTLVINPVSIGE